MLQHLPSSARENLDMLANIDEREHANVTGVQSLIERISTFVGSPAYFVWVVAFIAGWIAINAWGWYAGWRHVDAPPFPWLQGVVSSNALLLTIAVLIRQNRMARMAAHRAHLDLQINLLTEKKVTKILRIVDELRQELPALPTAPDEEVADLAKPADAEALLHAIKQKKVVGS
jgi:uncharacterized membrane protein